MLQNIIYLCLGLLVFDQAAAQLSTVDASQSFSDSTSIPGLYFALDGPHKFEGAHLVISEQTTIRFYRKDKDDVQSSNIRYQLDNADEVVYDQPFTVTGHGAHLIKLRQVFPDSESNIFDLQFSIDSSSPVVTVSVVYKSITLRRIELGKSAQVGRKPLECPIGSEIHVSATDDLSGVKSVILKEGKASLPLQQGAIELRSRGQHTYTIQASDFVGNVLETFPIVLQITEP